jgi:hypothetical protein
MRAVFAFLLAIMFPIGIWTVFVTHPQSPLLPSSDEETVAPVRQEQASDVRWMSGIVRSIDPRTGTVLLQTEKGPVRLFASPQVLHSLTEGAMVSAYIAADELATTVET